MGLKTTDLFELLRLAGYSAMAEDLGRTLGEHPELQAPAVLDEIVGLDGRLSAIEPLISADTETAETIVVDSSGVIDLGGRTLTSTADPVFQFEWGGADSVQIVNGRVVAVEGNCFNVDYLLDSVISVDVEMGRPDRSVWRQAGGHSYSTQVRGGRWLAAPGMSVPLIWVDGESHLNNVTFAPATLHTLGGVAVPSVPVAKLETTNGAWLYNNRFKDIVFEQPNAGAIHAYSVFGLQVENCVVYDCSAAGPITDHMWVVGGALKSVDCSFRNVARLGACDRATGLFDIYAVDHYPDSLVVENCGGTQGGDVVHKIPRTVGTPRGGWWSEVER